MPANNKPNGAWPPHLLAAMLAALLLAVPALLNGQPFFYPDTASYVRGADLGLTKLLGPAWRTEWAAPTPAELAAAGPAKVAALAEMPRLSSMQEQLVIAGRSVYYGALVYAAYLTSALWLAVAVQALAAAYLLQLLMVRLWSLGTPVFLASVALLAALTPLGAFAGLLMPDVFAPLIVLAMAALAVYWQRLRVGDRLGLAAIACFGLVSHPSHLAVGAALLAVLGAALLLARPALRPAGAGVALGAACLVLAFAAEWLFIKMVALHVGQPPVRMPHPTARLIDMGPGSSFLRASCPQSGYAACAWVDNYPTPWTAFLFSVNPQTGAFALADAATKRRIAQEQLPFFLDVIRFDPLGVASGLGADILRQLLMFEVDTLEYGRETPRYAARLPAATFATLRRSGAAQDSSANESVSAATRATVLAALGLAAALALRRREQAAAARDGPHWADFKRYATVVLAGVLCNAGVCATLAAPFDRFQARIVWLVPFLVLAALALTREQWMRKPRPEVPDGLRLVAVDEQAGSNG